MSISRLVELAAVRIFDAGIAGARTDARLLMQHVIGFDHARLIAESGQGVACDDAVRFFAAVERRCMGEPVSRIVGEREFFGLSFEITPAVLDPRPETEILVERALDDFGHATAAEFCDVGCGSGAIGIAMLTAMPCGRCVAVDASPEALVVAGRNGLRHGVAHRLECVRSDFLDGTDRLFDFIVSNPPYIASGMLGGLPPEVRLHDPAMALDGGADGLDAYRRILAAGSRCLKPGGRIYLEIGAGQEADCRHLAKKYGFRHVASVPDLRGIPRLVVLEPSARATAGHLVTNNCRKSLESKRERASFDYAPGWQ